MNYSGDILNFITTNSRRVESISLPVIAKRRTTQGAWCVHSLHGTRLRLVLQLHLQPAGTPSGEEQGANNVNVNPTSFNLRPRLRQSEWEL